MARQTDGIDWGLHMFGMDYEDLVDGLVDELVLLRESAKEYMRVTGSEDVRLKEIIHVEQ